MALSALALVFALQPAYSSTITVTTTDDELLDNGTCSLREAIRAANSDAAVDACAAGNSADRILLPAGTYTLTIEGRAEDASASGDLDITSDLAIQGAGADVTIVQACAPTPEEPPCPGIDRVFHIDPTGARISVEISGLTVQNGSTVLISFVNSAGGAILLGVANTLGDTVPAGTLTLRDTVVRNSSTPRDGGGIANQGGRLIVDRSTVSGNAAGQGGGLYNHFLGELTITGSTLRRNVAGDGGRVVEHRAAGGRA